MDVLVYKDDGWKFNLSFAVYKDGRLWSGDTIYRGGDPDMGEYSPSNWQDTIDIYPLAKQVRI